MLLSPDTVAPDFTLPDQDGVVHSLSQYRGSWVLLYFYPKDATPGCTTEACSLSEALPNFTNVSATVLGVSADSVASHKKFAEVQNLSITLLSDTEKTMLKDYGAYGPKTFMGRTYDGISRISYLIDPRGRIARVYDKVKPAEHAAQVLADLTLLNK